VQYIWVPNPTIATYGSYGNGLHQFNRPSALESWRVSYTAAPGGGRPLVYKKKLLVSDTYNGRVVNLEYDYNVGRLNTNSWIGTISGFNHPIDVAAQGTDYREGAKNGYSFWVADLLNNCVYQINNILPTGNINLNSISNTETPNNTDSWIPSKVVFRDLYSSQPFRPKSIVIRHQASNMDQNEYLYIASNNEIGMYYIELFNPQLSPSTQTGELVKVITRARIPSSGLISKLIIDNLGNIWVLDNVEQRVFKYSPILEYLGGWSNDGAGKNFYQLITGKVREGDLNIVDGWSENDGVKTFDITGINILNAGLNIIYDRMATQYASIVRIKTDNAYQFYWANSDGSGGFENYKTTNASPRMGGTSNIILSGDTRSAGNALLPIKIKVVSLYNANNYQELVISPRIIQQPVNPNSTLSFRSGERIMSIDNIGNLAIKNDSYISNTYSEGFKIGPNLFLSDGFIKGGGVFQFQPAIIDQFSSTGQANMVITAPDLNKVILFNSLGQVYIDGQFFKGIEGWDVFQGKE
jgi:hypothetical protein